MIGVGFWYYNANAESYWANGKWNWRPDVNLTGNSQNNPSGQKCWSPERGYYVAKKNQFVLRKKELVKLNL